MFTPTTTDEDDIAAPGAGEGFFLGLLAGLFVLAHGARSVAFWG